MNVDAIITRPFAHRCAAALAATLAIAVPTLARANTEVASTTTVDASATAAALAPTDAPPIADAPAPQSSTRGNFSGGRLVVEMLAGAVVGSLVGYGVYSAVGGDGIGPVLAGLGAEIVVAPLVVYGTGRAMGGQGTLGMTYLGGLIAFSGPSASPEEAVVSLAVGMVLMPVTSALMFEVSSHMRSKRAAAVVRAASLTPVGDSGGVTGLRASVGVAF